MCEFNNDNCYYGGATEMYAVCDGCFEKEFANRNPRSLFEYLCLRWRFRGVGISKRAWRLYLVTLTNSDKAIDRKFGRHWDKHYGCKAV